MHPRQWLSKAPMTGRRSLKRCKVWAARKDVACTRGRLRVAVKRSRDSSLPSSQLFILSAAGGSNGGQPGRTPIAHRPLASPFKFIRAGPGPFFGVQLHLLSFHQSSYHHCQVFSTPLSLIPLSVDVLLYPSSLLARPFYSYLSTSLVTHPSRCVSATVQRPTPPFVSPPSTAPQPQPLPPPKSVSIDHATADAASININFPQRSRGSRPSIHTNPTAYPNAPKVQPKRAH